MGDGRRRAGAANENHSPDPTYNIAAFLLDRLAPGRPAETAPIEAVSQTAAEAMEEAHRKWPDAPPVAFDDAQLIVGWLLRAWRENAP